ncbi:MAG TPA: M20/M25/M40 family metallo-hydrolase [Gemmatimonadaceae bacterium]|nr:M20/M25/M40 family metallo-hydrolase [Gemmatimonadaceae bacterium]
MTNRVLLGALLLLGPGVLGAQPGAPPRQIPPARGALPIPAESLPPYVRQTAPADSVILRIWEEGTQRSQVATLAQVLVDSIGARLTASPEIESASRWVMSMYQRWGIPARQHRYGTWPSWQRGYTHVDLIAPRTRTLEAMTLAWSPGTGGKSVTGDVVTLPDSASRDAYTAWLRGIRGKFVLASAPQLSCRSRDQWAEYGTPESRARLQAQQDSVNAIWRSRNAAADSLQDRLRAAGAAGVITHGFSGYPGIDKIFGSPRLRVLTLDITCEDYGLLARLAERRQSPRLRVEATADMRGERPVFNTIAEIRGREKPDEYVVLSAHFDSWSASGGATDNGTGTVAMMEAMRILKTVLPAPRRTILVGHWSGEEQGLNGSRAFVEDHPAVVQGLQALFNQDNGTGRIVSMSPGALPGTAPMLQRYLGEVPREITQYIRFGQPGMPATGGSDHASFACAGAPAFGLGSLSWDYGLTTWHTNRDTYDKIVLDDLRHNAILIAALAYQASEDPASMPRDRLDPLPVNPETGQPRPWPECRKALRAAEGYSR